MNSTIIGFDPRAAPTLPVSGNAANRQQAAQSPTGLATVLQRFLGEGRNGFSISWVLQVYQGCERLAYLYPFREIWGATARILRQFLDIIADPQSAGV